jgi:uncharacterized protein (DUF3820 family)
MLTDYDPMPFGKHEGKKMIDVPAQYLIWLGSALATQGKLPPKSYQVYEYIEENYEVLQKELEENGEVDS